MFWLYTVLLFSLSSLLCEVRRRTLKVYDVTSNYHQGRNFFLGCTIFFTLIVILNTGSSYSNQVSDIEDAKKFDEVGSIYSKKAEVLTAQFTANLAILYPQHEKDIFGKIGPENVSVYLVQYPEIKANETIVKLVDMIDELQSDVYDQKVKRAEIQKNIRCRTRNPWTLNIFIPTE